MASAASPASDGNTNKQISLPNVQNLNAAAAARAKEDLKKLLVENRLNVDDEVRITDQSDVNSFKLIVKTKRFSAKDFTTEIEGTKLVIKAAYEKMKADNMTRIREKFVYEHELPKDVDDASMTKNFVAEGILEVAIKRKLTT